jgi:hypothetical protein
MAQHGQVFPLAAQGSDPTRWAYRYRVGGRGSRRLQRGGFASEQAAAEALVRALERLRRQQGWWSRRRWPSSSRCVSPSTRASRTVEKLRWLLAKAVRVFGERRLSQLHSPALAAWRVTIPAGRRFEATQALRQVLARAVTFDARSETVASSRRRRR